MHPLRETQSVELFR